MAQQAAADEDHDGRDERPVLRWEGRGDHIAQAAGGCRDQQKWWEEDQETDHGLTDQEIDRGQEEALQHQIDGVDDHFGHEECGDAQPALALAPEDRAICAKEVQREDGDQKRQGGVEIQNGQGLPFGFPHYEGIHGRHDGG